MKLSRRDGPLLVFSIALVVVVAAFVFLLVTYPPDELSTNPSAFKHEMLLISATTDASRSQLQISVVNTGQVDATVTLVEFNGVALPSSDIVGVGGFTRTPQDTFSLPSRASGNLTIAKPYLGILSSGATYPIALTTAAGSNFSASILWP